MPGGCLVGRLARQWVGRLGKREVGRKRGWKGGWARRGRESEDGPDEVAVVGVVGR
jgi:hypothetical protein